jgi:hydrogenase-4 component B
MNIIFYSLTILAVSGVLALCLTRFDKLSNIIGAIGAVCASIIGLISLFVVYNNPSSAVISIPWSIPYASFSAAIDSLSILFLFPIFVLSGISALYGLEYLKHYYGKKNLGSAWFLFNILIISMVLVIISRNAILFLLAWEMMSVSSFFLVLFEGEKKEASRAGLIYLIATHIGTLFLLVMFMLLSGETNSFDFAQWHTAAPGFITTVIFLCALIGFGTKAGFMPMHVWLPEAHPAAPSHVSAVMSGVMIKTGIYGLVRVITFLGVPCLWWGYLIIGIGAVSGILGVLFALAQHDFKRLLAYSSIENIGIISIAIGLGVVGMSINNPVLAAMGFAGGLLHVINHAFFKGLLFLGAGVVYHQTGTRDIDVLGGLIKKMPVTGLCFLIGAAAICGLPPLNGFVSEFFIYLASFKGILGSGPIVVVSLVAIAFLAMIGTLAAACFTRVFGIIFLGEARSSHCQPAKEPGRLIKTAMLTLAGLCVFMGLAAPFMISFFKKAIVDLTGMQPVIIKTALSEAEKPLLYIAAVLLSFYIIILFIAGLRGVLLKKRRIESALTWDCGYADPKPSMQYTASSFVQPIVDFFKGILRTKKYQPKIEEYFPDEPSFNTETSDLFNEILFNPAMKFIHNSVKKLTWIQHGRLQFYILYIFFTLLALFIWKL